MALVNNSQSHGFDTRSLLKSSNVRVVARIRPMSKEEQEAGCQSSIRPLFQTKAQRNASNEQNVNERSRSIKSSPNSRRASTRTPPRLQAQRENTILNVNRPSTGQLKSSNKKSLVAGTENHRCYEFDDVFGQNSTQNEVYARSIGESMKRNINCGLNTAIIAIGQNGTGKSHTMSGGWKMDFASNNIGKLNVAIADNDGILPRAVNDIFLVKKYRISKGDEVAVTMSFVEVSSEGLRDLLSEAGASMRNFETPLDEGIDMKGLTWKAVNSSDRVKTLMSEASKQRAKNQANRGHLVCRLHIAIKYPLPGTARSTTASFETTSATLTLANLAGTETKLSAEEIALQNVDISSDMRALDHVVQALGRKGMLNRDDVPYADSTITQLLRDTLGGNCRTVVIACLSPADFNIEASIATLRLGESSQKITNLVKPNVESKHKASAKPVTMLVENKRHKAKMTRRNVGVAKVS
jgi:hypothetical protein